jgi:hypothetical protein
MAARTAIVPVQLVNDNGVSQGAGTTIAGALVTNGATIPAPGPYNILLVVNNTFTSPANITIRASRSGVDAGGNTQANVPGNVVFTAATIGDLVVSVPNAGTVAIPIWTTDRFTQDDGSLSLDFGASMTGTVYVYRLPYVNPS